MITSARCTNKLLMPALCCVLAVWIVTPAFIQLGEKLIQVGEQFIQDTNKSPQIHVQPSLCMTSAS